MFRCEREITVHYCRHTLQQRSCQPSEHWPSVRTLASRNTSVHTVSLSLSNLPRSLTDTSFPLTGSFPSLCDHGQCAYVCVFFEYVSTPVSEWAIMCTCLYIWSVYLWVGWGGMAWCACVHVWCMWVCVCVYLCVHVCVHACVYLRKYVSLRERKGERLY